MAGSTHRVLRVILGFLSLLTAAAAVFMIFGGRGLIVRLLLGPPEPQVSTLLLATLKELGGVLVMLSVLFFLAARDPVRNVAIIDALIVGLCVLAVTPLVSLYTLDLRSLYPAYLIWARSLVRGLLAVSLYYLRPRNAAADLRAEK